MNEITRAGIILNAAKIPYEIFMKLCKDYEPSEIFSGEAFWKELGMNNLQRQRISEIISKDGWAEKELERIENINTRFITAIDIDYPAKLKDLKKPPVGLYVRGSANISLPSVAIVGTRKPSDYAKVTASKLGRELGKKGLIVISGGARGIDSAGHRGCLAEDGINIAVFATGIERIYPSENRDLFSRILERGALITEYPTGTGGEKWRFPERNRIVAGMASRIIVVESPEKGGAMITARLSEELKRDLRAVPGRINEEVCRGSNKLLAEGAKVLYNIDEFVQSIKLNEQTSINFDEFISSNNNDIPELNDDEKKIFSLLQEKGSRLTDEIISESQLDFTTVQAALIQLEIYNLVTNSSGRYSASS